MTDIFKDYWNQLETMEDEAFKESEEVKRDSFLAISSVLSFFYLKNSTNGRMDYATLTRPATTAEKNYVKGLIKKNNATIVKSADVRGNKINLITIAIKVEQEASSEATNKVLESHFKRIEEGITKYIQKTYNFSNGASVTLPDIYENELTAGQKIGEKLLYDVKNGIIRGDSYDDITDYAKEWYEKRSRNEIKKIVRTEGTAITNAVGLKMFEENGYTEYKYASVIDSRTSDICRELNDHVFKISEAERGVNFPPMHVNCRSGFEIILEGEE